jgi:hypothetical protein
MPAADTPAGTSPPAGVRVARYTPSTRQLCSDCTQEIHRLGVGLAALPRPVRWRYSTGALTLLLCESHKNTRLEKK